MKYLFLSQGAHLVWDPSAPRAAGGAELQAALMARDLVRLGHEAVIVGADTGQPDGVEWQGIRIRNGGRFDTGGVFDTLRAWPRIHNAIAGERPDFVVVYGWTALLYALAWWRRIVPFRLVFVCALDAEIDGTLRQLSPLRGLLFYRGMQMADCRCSITEAQASDFRRQGMECTVVRLLVRDEACSSTGGKPVDLLWVARCERVKRPDLFLELARKLPGVRCRMICSIQDDKLHAETKAAAAELTNLEFVDGVAYCDIQVEFDRAKILVNTSSHEGVPNTFIHAGLGKTAVASLEVNPDDMFGQFAAGVLARGSFDELFSGIRGLLEDDQLLDRAAAESLRHVRERHRNDSNVEAFLRATSSS